MINLNQLQSYSIPELEKLSWYEFVSKIGLMAFNLSGKKPITRIAELTKIKSGNKVLMVGCGAGGTAIYLAEMTGATVYGIDIAEESIKQAQNHASASVAAANLHFQIADAQKLPFESETFDLLITEYMAFFLRPDAFSEFFHVLKPGGQIALAELMLDPQANEKVKIKIQYAEKIYSELLQLSFHIPSVTDYETWLYESGFQNTRIRDYFSPMPIKERVQMVGGWKVLFKMMGPILHMWRKSKILKEKFIKQAKVKDILIKNRSTKKFILQALLMAEKPRK